MTAIYKRELKAYFHSVIGWLFIAIVLFLIDLYFTVYNVKQGYPYISYALQSAIIIFIIAIPVLTMRILAEERKNRTDQLLLTAPVSVGKIVLGKYLAMETVFLVPCLVTCIYPVVMGRFGTVSYLESYVTILAFFLYGSAAMAVGTLISACTESTVIAAVVSVLVVFIGYVMSGLCNMISNTGNVVTKILSAYDLSTPFSNLINGSLDLTSIFYDVSLIAFLLFLTVQAIQKRRYSVSVKNFTMGAYNTTMILVVLAVTVAANVLIGKIPTEYTKFDITSDQLYSLTDASYQVMDELDSDITIYVLSKESNMDTTISETLQRYDGYSKHISVEYVDPDSNPTFYQQYTDSSVSSGSLIIVSDKRSKCIDYNDLYASELNYETYSYDTTGYDGEGQITSALAYVTSDEMPKIYMITGHGEADFETSFLSAVTKLNVEYEALNLLDVDQIPEDAQAVVVNAPTADFSTDDAAKVEQYLSDGGKALFLYGYGDTALTNYRALLEKQGIQIVDGMVVEADSQYYYQNMMYLLPNVESDELTDSASQNYIFMPYASGITVDQDAVDSEKVTYLLTTSDLAFSRTNLQENTNVEKTDGDIDGPFALGAKTDNAVIFTSAMLFTSSADQMVAGNNLNLFTAAIGSFVSVESSVSIPVKSYEMSFLSMSSADILAIELSTVIVIPLLLLITGLVIWFRRRRR